MQRLVDRLLAWVSAFVTCTGFQAAGGVESRASLWPVFPVCSQSLLHYVVRLFCTLRHISPKQGVYLVRNRLKRSVMPSDPSTLSRRAWRRPWSSPRWRPPAWQRDGSVTLLGRSRKPASDEIWNGEGESRLWCYNLHYLDDLDARDGSVDVADRRALLDRWISGNPPAKGTGWEPFPLSLRIVNIVKFAAHTPEPNPRLDHSLALQAQSLSHQIEWHIRANHLFENGKALVFAGAYFDGPSARDWLRKGLEILDAECEEQFLPDGGHFELSPMYHGAMLWNLCDLLNLADATGLPELLSRSGSWVQRLRQGLNWYAAMTHPDGEIAFFNDAAMGVSPKLKIVEIYAETVGAQMSSVRQVTTAPALVALQSSGYLRVDFPHQCVAIIDVAQVGPDYQPGHAHADVLSFELSLYGCRVVVNSGTSTYERGPQRDEERGTEAHSTVTIDHRNSSDTWAGFRVGHRAKPELLGIEATADQIVIRAQHDGYRRPLGGAVHRRRWTLTASEVRVQDEVIGTFHHAAARYHVHPDVAVRRDTSDPRMLHLELPNGKRATFQAEEGRLSVCRSSWHAEFGRSVDTTCIVIEFFGACVEVLISWADQT